MKQTKTPRVSCLLPVYNGEKYIVEAVESVLNQTFDDLELVIVDDGSTDSTPDKLRMLAESDARVRLIRQDNSGIVSALNTGISYCRADYVARMDCDDVSSTDRFDFQVNYLDNHPKCVLVGGVARSMTEHSTYVRYTTGGRYRQTDLSLFPPRIAVAVHPLVMMRRSTLLAMGGYRADYPHAEDYDLFIRLSAYGTVENPRKEILFYRRHENAVSVRHLEVQERNAALAERDAIASAGHASVEDWLLEPYTRLRIFRRLQMIDMNRARDCVITSSADLLNVSRKSLFSRRYWRLRFIIAYNIVKYIKRSMTPSYRRLHSIPSAS